MRPEGLWWSNVLDSAHPPQRLRLDTQPEQQDPASTCSEVKEEKREKQKQTDRIPNQMVKAKLNRQNHRKKHTHTLIKRK